MRKRTTSTQDGSIKTARTAASITMAPHSHSHAHTHAHPHPLTRASLNVKTQGAIVQNPERMGTSTRTRARTQVILADDSCSGSHEAGADEGVPDAVSLILCFRHVLY